MISNEQKQLAQWAMEYALKNGCQASRVSLYTGFSSSIDVRDMKIDKLQQASENGLVINIYVDGRYGSFSTNRLDKHELERFIKNGIESTRFLAEDKYRTLPDASLYYKGNGKPLELIDPKFDSIDPDEKVAMAMKVCEEIYKKDERIISANGSYGDEKSFKYMIASNGFEGETANTSYTLVGNISIKGEGETRPESYWYDSDIFYDKLQKEGIGLKAMERVLKKLGQKKIASGSYPMVVDNMNSAQLLSPVINALYGSSIQQKNSFLLGKQDQLVLGNNVTLRDEPHLYQAEGARYFDGEGVATTPRNIFDKGILKTYFIDTYNANKMQVKQTISSPSILTMDYGTKDVNGLIASLDKGILITGFNGGNSNSSTGDFSYGIEGFLIENGKTTQPINEMNITGNMLTLWNNLKETGNDFRKSSSWRIPSLLFDDVDFSGL